MGYVIKDSHSRANRQYAQVQRSGFPHDPELPCRNRGIDRCQSAHVIYRASRGSETWFRSIAALRRYTRLRTCGLVFLRRKSRRAHLQFYLNSRRSFLQCCALYFRNPRKCLENAQRARCLLQTTQGWNVYRLRLKYSIITQSCDVRGLKQATPNASCVNNKHQ